jgi:hypothetical protein
MQTRPFMFVASFPSSNLKRTLLNVARCAMQFTRTTVQYNYRLHFSRFEDSCASISRKNPPLQDKGWGTQRRGLGYVRVSDLWRCDAWSQAHIGVLRMGHPPWSWRRGG